MEQTTTYVTVPAGSVKRSVSIGVPGIQVTASLTHQIPHYIQMTLPGTSQYSIHYRSYIYNTRVLKQGTHEQYISETKHPKRLWGLPLPCVV